MLSCDDFTYDESGSLWSTSADIDSYLDESKPPGSYVVTITGTADDAVPRKSVNI